jgi:signal transduction histidine kinase
MTARRARILAIDDTPANLMTLGSALESEFDLQFATAGAIGVALALRNPPDLILLDVMMPEMDGFEVCRRIKLHPLLQHIPVVFLTALNDSASENAGLALGAADYITKPINVETAHRRISNLLEREQLRKEVESNRDHLEELLLSGAVALSIAKEAAEAADHAKTRLLNNVTHELRTPMNAIMGLTELALGRASDAKQAEQLGKVQTASEHLLALITQMMDLTGLQAKQLSLEQKPFKLTTVLESLSRLLAPDAQCKGLTWSTDIQPECERLALQGDTVRLGQVLLAMAGNAIKFTPQGSVAVLVTLVEQGDSDVVLCFEVRDTGIGIAQPDQRRIFGSFEQLDGSRRRSYGGTGLGLALSRQLVELMGGECGVKSQPGVGSVFWFTARLITLESTP